LNIEYRVQVYIPLNTKLFILNTFILSNLGLVLKQLNRIHQKQTPQKQV